MKIVLMCSNDLLNNNGGINTFFRHFFSMSNFLKLDVTLVTDICRDDFSFSDDDLKKIICGLPYNFNESEAEYACPNDEYTYRNIQADRLTKLILNHFDVNEEYIFISNCHVSTEALNNLVYKYSKSKFISYTHIGDLFHEDEDSYDFDNKFVEKYIKTISTNAKIINCTQLEDFIPIVNSKTGRNDTVFANEPFYDSEPELFFDNDFKSGIIIICANYKRKRLDKMIEILSHLDEPVKIITTALEHGYYDINRLLSKYKVQGIVLENVPNKDILLHVKMSKLLLHVADIEVCPYSIIESSSILPVAVNGDANWSKAMSNFVYYISEDPVVAAKEIKELLKAAPKNDYKKYVQEFENQWKNILFGGEYI